MTLGPQGPGSDWLMSKVIEPIDRSQGYIDQVTSSSVAGIDHVSRPPNG
jgi:hypothetical protein